MRYSNRLFLYAPFAVLLIIAAAAMLRWREVADQWQTKLLAANRGEEIAPGVTLHFTSEEIGGFPFNLDIVLDKFVLAVRSTRGPISLESERFAIHALTYGRTQQVMESAGLQILIWTDAEGGAHRFTFVPGSLRASAIERDGRLTRFDLDLSEFASSAFTGARAQLHLRAAPDRDALDFLIRADDLRVRSRGAALPHVDIEGKITPAKPLSALLSGNDEWREALGRWRVADGALRLDQTDITWDTSHVAGNGSFAFDASNHMRGAMEMQLSDVRQWRPTHLVGNPFTFALQDLVESIPRGSSSRLLLSLDIHSGAAMLRAAGKSRAAGMLDPVF